jgi:hypothetical protein
MPSEMVFHQLVPNPTGELSPEIPACQVNSSDTTELWLESLCSAKVRGQAVETLDERVPACGECLEIVAAVPVTP